MEGTFVREGKPISPCEAIVESGDRDESSPYRLRGVGPVARADAKGQFRSWYVTEGAATPIARPGMVSVYVRVAKASWKPVVVPIPEDRARALSDTEMHLDLGAVRIPGEMQPYAQD